MAYYLGKASNIPLPPVNRTLYQIGRGERILEDRDRTRNGDRLRDIVASP